MALRATGAPAHLVRPGPGGVHGFEGVLTILEGSTFCISADDGTIAHGISGFFADDTRFLSRMVLCLDGEPPALLRAGRVDYFDSAHFLRNVASRRHEPDTFSIARERFVFGRVLEERIRVRNEGAEPTSTEVTLELASDFVDVLTLKAHTFARQAGEEEDVPGLPAAEPPTVVVPGELLLTDPQSELATWVRLSQVPSSCAEGVARFELRLEPGEAWEVVVEVAPGRSGEPPGSPLRPLRFGREELHVRSSLAAWGLVVPRFSSPERGLEVTFQRSLADLASLRIQGSPGYELPAAGMPWFMTVFGRDTLITSLQTLLLGPDLAIGALRTLASLQAVADDPATDAEPGKIPHELRRGKAAVTWFPLYYGTVDATPLFLVLLSEVWRWTGDATLVHELREPALRALEWVERHGDRDGDGFLEYERRTPRGLENQSWKDSGDSQRFADGALASTPIAPCEVQGYAYDARLRTAELARAVWGDEQLASRLERDAHDLARRFDEAFWMEDRGAYALGLDGEKRRIDSVCSNIGHLLWSGIVPQERVDRIADVLLRGPLWSGWGIRTMAAGERAYNPIRYHNGTVWPHDTSLAAWGLMRSGHTADALVVTRAILDAAESFEGSLPEVFAGFDRRETPFVVAYPTSARPQAWAAGAPILCLQLALGLRPEQRSGRLVSEMRDAPAWLEGLELDGVRALGSRWSVAVRNGRVRVREST